MRVLSLKARGFIGFKKGLGLDEIAVDFNGLNGLVALAGPNGHGKSTMLENLSPFRTLASRAGALRHHTFLRDSYRELDFEMMGDVYKTLIKIDADSDRSEGFIWKNGMPQIDGKVSNYNNYLVRLLGTANLFYNSVFCAQNSQRLSDMNTGDLKSLFTEFLRLDRLAGYEKNSKQCISVLESMKGIADRRAESLKERLEKLTETASALEGLYEDKKQIISDIETTKQAIINTEVNIHLLTQTISRNEELEKESAGIKETLLIVKNSLTGHVAQGDKKELYFIDEIEGIKERIKECNQTLQERESIEMASGIIAQKDREIQSWTKRIEGWAKEKKQVTDEYVARSDAMNNTRLELSKQSNASHIDKLGRERLELERKIDAKKAEIQRLEDVQQRSLLTTEMIQIQSEIKTCRSQMELLDKRDPACQSQGCVFILSGIEAQKCIPELEKKLKELTTAGQEKVDRIALEIEELNSEIIKLSEDLNRNSEAMFVEMKELDIVLKKLKRALAQDQVRLDTVIARGKELAKRISDGEIEIRILRDLKANFEKLAARLPQLEVATMLHSELTRQLASICDDKKVWIVDHARQETRILQSVMKYESQLREIQEKILSNADQDLVTAKANLLLMQQTFKDLENRIAELNTEISKHKAKIEEKTDAEKELAAVESEIASYKKDISEWTYLRNACGKNGLQALEIDGVAPLITSYANDLLTQSFGPNFTVKLVTQDQLTGKETLDIMVIREDGAETLLENLSGGEKVWILKALRLAMTLVSKEKSGRNFQSFFSDEEDGALDGEKALNFVGLYRSLMTTGGFDTCYYISHNPDVVAMADHQILFSGSGIEVV